MIISIIISILLIIISIIYKKSRFIALLTFIFMWILFGWNYMNGDYIGYENMFAYNDFGVSLKGYEAGFKSLMMLFLNKGYDFQSFFIIISAIILFLMFHFVIKFSEYPAFITSIFFIFYFPLDYVILRNFLAFALILQGFLLVFKEKKHAKLYFALIVALAMTIHISSVFYFLFLFAFKKYKINYKRILLFVVIGLIIYIPLKVILFNSLFSDVGEKNEVYKNSFPLFVFLSFIQVLNFIFIRYVIKSNQINFNNKKFINPIYIYNINVILLFLIVFYFDMGIFVRIFRNMSFLNVIFITNLIISNKSSKNSSIRVFLFLYLLFIYSYFILLVLDNSLFSLYKYNLIFK